MDEPKRIDGIIDEAMREILGAAGNEFYAELVKQTEATRAAIEREVRGRFQDVFADVFGELTGLRMPPEQLEFAARMEANRRIQQEIARRISEEETAFRERMNRLYRWSKGEQRRKNDDSHPTNERP